MKNLTLFFIALAAMAASFTSAFGLTQEDQIQILKGLDKVYIVVERLRPEIERDGLFSDTLQTDVEMKLRMAGIRLLSTEEDTTPHGPHLYLHVDAFKYKKGYVYRVQLCLREPVTLARKGSVVMAATLRIPDELGITHNLSDIRDEADVMLDQFIKLWTTANAK